MLHLGKLGKTSIFYLKICLIITALSTIFPEGSFTGSDINVHKMASRNSSGALKKKLQIISSEKWFPQTVTTFGTSQY